MTELSAGPRRCLIDPVPEIAVAARHLDAAVAAHVAGDRTAARELLRLADVPAIREWTESLWGRSHAIPERVAQAGPKLPKVARVPARMPGAAQRRALHARDGYHCRFCGIPVVRAEVRDRLRAAYPDVVRWGARNAEQHAGLQAMWAQYDHVVPHARGGDNQLANLVVACAPCNCARMDCTVEEVGLLDPRTREPIRSGWDGLERLLGAQRSRPGPRPAVV
jgi:5-methylcytosine-specific restriction endonuclease McrA